jgi:tetratricopeptide (TPR) repeat protein/SAM-dependent methyltransferase
MTRFGRKRAKPSVITLADQARDQRQWERASGYYREALQRKPQNPPIWVQYGHVLKESGHWADAERAYRTAIAYNPGSADGHLQLGHVLKLQGKKEEARTAYLRAVALEPSLNGVSFEFAQLGWSEAHVSELRAMLGTTLTDPMSLPRVISTHAEPFDRPGPAATIGAKSGRNRLRMPRLALKRSRPSRITLADRARDAGQWELAAQHYLEALSRNPRNSPIWVQYGHVLKEAGKLSEAENAYRRAIELDPDSADSHLQLGHTLKLQGKGNEAAEKYLQASVLDPSLEDAARELRGFGRSPALPSELKTRDMARSDCPRDEKIVHGNAASGAAGAGGRIHDAVSAVYALVLGRLPESPRDSQENFTRPLIEVADTLIASGEFRKRVLDEFCRNRKLPHESLSPEDQRRVIDVAREAGLDPPHQNSAFVAWEVVLHAVFRHGRGYESLHRHHGPLAGHFVTMLNRAMLPDDFDPFLYLGANPDVAAAGVDPVEHFLDRGRIENRRLRPNYQPVPDDFDPEHFLDTRPSRTLAPSFPLRDGTLPWPTHAFHFGHCDHNKLHRNRAIISYLYLKGDGIEVKAWNAPFPIRRDSKVNYVDSLTGEQLRDRFPHLAGLTFVKPDILDDEQTLQKVLNESKDFAVFSGALPYFENPILALQNACRVVKPGGAICISVPDKRYGIDVRRPVTDLDHFWKDYSQGPEVSRRDHYEEFIATVLNGHPPEPPIRPERLIYSQYPIHFHVWTHHSFIRFIENVVEQLQLTCEIELVCRNEIETICVLRKLRTEGITTPPS